MTADEEESLVDVLFQFSVSIIAAISLILLIHPFLLFTLRVILEIIVFTIDPHPCQAKDVTDWWFCQGWDWPLYAIQDLIDTYANAVKRGMEEG